MPSFDYYSVGTASFTMHQPLVDGLTGAVCIRLWSFEDFTNPIDEETTSPLSLSSNNTSTVPSRYEWRTRALRHRHLWSTAPRCVRTCSDVDQLDIRGDRGTFIKGFGVIVIGEG